MNTQDATTCPECGAKGRSVRPVTLRSLLVPDAVASIGDESYRFCRARPCAVVYFNESHTSVFHTDAVRVVVFQKTDAPDRPVCYCFGHTVRSIEEGIAAAECPDVAQTIAEKCNAGLDDCPKTNPQGACCLGNVRQVIRAAAVAGSAEREPTPHDCCGSGSVQPTAKSAEVPEFATEDDRGAPIDGRRSPDGAPLHSQRAGVVAACFAVLGALLSSACCWLPLAFIGMGVSTVGVAGFFEAYRSALLVTTAGLLSFGFYFVYVRNPKCDTGDMCRVPDQRLLRLNKVSLWVATVLVVLFAAFPSYFAALGQSQEASPVRAEVSSSTQRVYAIEGMTCEGCTGHVRAAIRELPNVVAVNVSYPDRTATVEFAGDATDGDVLRALDGLIGYSARPVDEALRQSQDANHPAD